MVDVVITGVVFFEIPMVCVSFDLQGYNIFGLAPSCTASGMAPNDCRHYYNIRSILILKLHSSFVWHVCEGERVLSLLSTSST